jgi:hypothetical protein
MTRERRRNVYRERERAREPFAFASIERPAPVHIPLSPPPYIMGRKGGGEYIKACRTVYRQIVTICRAELY